MHILKSTGLCLKILDFWQLQSDSDPAGPGTTLWETRKKLNISDDGPFSFIPTLRAEGLLSWFTSLLLSKHLVFDRYVFQLCFQRYTVAKCPESPLIWLQDYAYTDETWRCFIPMLRSLPKEGICTLLSTIPAMCKGPWKIVHALAILVIFGNFLPFPRAPVTYLPPTT